AETKRLQAHRLTVQAAIVRSVDAFVRYAARQTPRAEQPKQKTLPEKKQEEPSESKTILPERKQEDPSSLAEQKTLPEKKSERPLDSTPMQPRIAFHPLAAAVDATRKQLQPPPKSSPSEPQAPAGTAADVAWLAQTSLWAKDELPLPEARRADPAAVKTNPLLRQQWDIYWTLSSAWRALYVQHLMADP